ncbi:ankyrin repeat and SOCS box protein 7 [Chaetomium fimeti]|uniref:Ankyrin repeat and SOCS box protein 7 n=1 Tax=Chaetomium fimeti TaxID=1854472 RepID=A0AAE0H882_9PEZI|nr:ankyrin repeat and SOCS box protein 7 [Chaetomium fimeti]
MGHGNMEDGGGHGTSPSLWEAAFDALSAEDQKVLQFARTDVPLQPSEIVQVVEQKKLECVKKQWVLYTNKKGEEVLVRDVLGKVVDYIDRFKEVADTAVHFDPGHAAIPWAVIRMLLQSGVNDSQTFGAMADSLEQISSIIVRYTDLETRVLIRTSVLTGQLSAAILRLYGSALEFLAHACRYYGQSTLKRALKSIGKTAKMMVEEPLFRIEKDEEAVYKLASLVQNEISGVKLDDILRSIKQSVEGFHTFNEERCKRLSAWINGIDTKNTYETALQYHHDGTCEWVLELDQFRAWESGDAGDPSDSRLLWIHGPAGFGKTFISAWAIRHLQLENKAPLSYFFCVADNQLTRDPYAILRSWLAQILEQDPSVVSAMDTVYQARNKEQTLTHQGLWELFVAVGSAVEGCTFVVDGFDECTDIDTGARYHHDDPRNLFLRDLVLNLAKTTSRVLVVSRDVPDIREYLGQDTSPSGDSDVRKLEYGITAKDTTADVASFSEHMVNTKLPKKKAEIRQNIAAKAAQRSEGMFLWIKLLEREITPGRNVKELVKAVSEMPSGISEAYSRELEKIVQLPPDEKEKAVMILRWTLFAIRPLQVKQLAEALVVSDENLSEYPEDDLPDCWSDGFVDEDYTKEMILGRCGSLLQLRSTSSQQPLADHTVHFVHFSVKEYLSKSSSQRAATANRWVADLGLGDPAAEEARLSNICLRYLTLDRFEDIPSDTQVYPFLSYAAWAWYFHSFRDKPTPSQDIIDRTQRAFDPTTSSWRVWTPLMEAKLADSDAEEWSFGEPSSSEVGSWEDDDDSNSGDGNSDNDNNNSDDNGNDDNDGDGDENPPAAWTVQNPIYYASLLGLTDVVRWLEDQGLDCNCAGGRFGFPLQAAVVSGKEDLIRHLLNRSASVSQTGGQYGAAIVAAAAQGNPTTVQLLIAAGADLKAADAGGLTALHYIAKRGDLETARLLVEHGADINAAATATPQQLTPISLACFSGHSQLVSALIDLGADLAAAMSGAAAAMEVAIGNRDAATISVLLSKGNVSPNIPFPNGCRPLHCAVGQPAVVKLLLARGADPNLAQEANNAWVPLYLAAAVGDVESVEALLDGGAHVDGRSSDDEGELSCSTTSPLQAAVGNNNLAAAKALYARGADLDQTTQGGLTALLIAVGDDLLDVAAWLLDEGAAGSGVWEHTQQTAFDLAVDGSSGPEMAELLVKRGCFRARVARDGGEPIGEGTRGSSTPAVAAAAAGECVSDDLVMLAYHGALEELKAVLSRQTLPHQILGEAMRAAAARGHVRVVDLLIRRHGARVNVQDINERTALHYAARHLHKEVADLLVEHGASIDVEDMNGSTPIDLAVVHGKDAAGFIQEHMDNFTVGLNRRPSILTAITPNQATNLTGMGVRKAISGRWQGHYECLAWEEGRRDSFSLDIPSEAARDSRPSTFSMVGEDIVGPFDFHGFVDPIGTVWFVKLYQHHGWLYRGQVDVKKAVLKGTWGSNRKLWFGTFELKRIDD